MPGPPRARRPQRSNNYMCSRPINNQLIAGFSVNASKLACAHSVAVPICDRSRLVQSGAKADMAGGANWPGVCIRSLSRIRSLAPLAGALRRLRIVGGVGIVFEYARDEPASGERLQVPLQRVSNLLGIDLLVDPRRALSSPRSNG